MAEKYFAQPSVMNSQQHFAGVPAAEIERSRFDRSHGHKTTFDAGYIIPVYMDEVIPGDTFHMNSTMFARMATPLKPIMDNIYLDVHFFFCPNRLIWDEWEQFMGARNDPDDDPSAILHPKCSVKLNRAGNDLPDYFGIPRDPAATATADFSVSSLPFRAYYEVWNEWYRDQNIQPKINFTKTSGDGTAPQALQIRNKRHDYFTSCLPWPQKGDPVFIPIATSADVITNGLPVTIRGVTDNTERNLQVSFPGSTNTVSYSGAGISAAQNVKFGNETGLQVDLTEATAISINDLRTAFQVQRLLERDARGGTRYIELILAHFGVHSEDYRLQRPEYLGGGTTMVQINPIAATFAGGEISQGQLAGFGTVHGKAGFTKSFTEHGIVLGLVSVRADLTYQRGLEKVWTRESRYDYYWPALAHLGEQAVLTREIYAQGRESGVWNPTDLTVFGYQERYAEYRYKPSRITGLFASTHEESLDVWHLSQDFAAPPTLSALFIVEIPPIDRVIAVPSEPHFLLDAWFHLECERPMPVYSVPGLIDHF